MQFSPVMVMELIDLLQQVQSVGGWTGIVIVLAALILFGIMYMNRNTISAERKKNIDNQNSNEDSKNESSL